MATFLAILVLVYFCLTILGLFNPKYYGKLQRLIYKKYKDKSRGKLFVSNIFILIILFILFGYFAPPVTYKNNTSQNNYSNTSQNESHPKVSKYIKIDTRKMINVYNNNEARGDLTYKEKYIEFKGTVTKVSSGSFYGATVYVDEDSYGMGGLSIGFASLGSASKLNIGQEYAFRGEVEGRIMGIIDISEGQVVN